MAKADSEEVRLDWDDFRALEFFAIIYDIAIDEEQYNPECCRLEAPTLHEPYVPGKAKGNAEPWVTDPYLLFPDNPENPGICPTSRSVRASIRPLCRFKTRSHPRS